MEANLIPRIPAPFAVPCLFAIVLVILFGAYARKAVRAASSATPGYAANGDLMPPIHYREWIYLTSGIDMSYAPKTTEMADRSMFDNVFVNPESYRSFLRTGTWPDKTVLVLEVREARSKGSINQSGHYQGIGVKGFEVHVKDEARFPDKWAFFDFDSPTANGKLIPTDAPCYSCHAAHGAVDTTFVQFYPTLLPLAEQKQTLSPASGKESALPSANQ